jgi:hypothetical protein
MTKAVERWREAIAACVTQAYQQAAAQDATLGRRRGAELPAELARRAARGAKMEAARRRVEAQAKAAADAARPRRAAAEAERQRTGQKRRGQAPQPVEESPDDKAQSHGTAPDLRSRRTTNKDWDDGGNAPARVDGACQSMMACDGTDAAHDTPQAAPLAQAPLAHLTQAGLERSQDETGPPHASPATLDKGSDSEAAVEALAP